MAKEKKQKKDKIIALTQRQMLIKRMAIWFGRELGDIDNPYSSQKTVALREISDNSIDAITKSNRPGTIRITMYEDGSYECYDSGDGIPVDISKTADGKPASSLYLALGVMNAGSNYEDMGSTVGTNGVGGSGAQLLSSYTKVEVYRDKKRYRLDFKDGDPGLFDDNGNFTPTNDLTYLKVDKDNRPTEEKKTFPTGTKILIKLNDDLFKSKYPYNADDLIERLRGVAFLIPSIRIEIVNHLRKTADGLPQTEVFQFEDGIEQLVELNSIDKITNIHHISKETNMKEESVDIKDGKATTILIDKEIKGEAAFTYCNNYEYFMDSYVNTIKTRLHGFHVTAFERAFTTVMNNKLRSIRGGLLKSDEDPIFNDYAEGLCAVVSVSIPEPEFTSQIKEELGGRKVLRELTKIFTEAFEEWVNQSKNQDDIRKIADKVIAASRNRVKAREAQEIKRERARLDRSTAMPIKLVDCEITHTPESELFIVEGDSALSGLKAARNSKTQALIPIRGKILNVMKATDKAILQNTEVQDIIKCLDAGSGDDFDINKCRYGRVIIAADADPDGHNISLLLTVLFWRLFKDLILEGRLYKACTPLFIVKEGKNTHYCYNSEEYETLVMRLNSKNKKFTITRAKGLGETGAKVLHETGMNPETRTIERITAEDVEEAEYWLDVSMGSDVAPRRQWIEDNPIELEDLDD